MMSFSRQDAGLVLQHQYTAPVAVLHDRAVEHEPFAGLQRELQGHGLTAPGFQDDRRPSWVAGRDLTLALRS